MSILTIILATLVALECFYIFYLETIATNSKKSSGVFNISVEELSRPSLNTAMKNQGVYNGLIGVGLLYSIYLSTASVEITTMLLIYIVLAAIYGGLTSSKKIILTQGGLPLITLITMLF